MSEPSKSYNYEADTFVSTTPTDLYTYGTDTFEGSHDSDASSQPKSYSTDTFVTQTGSGTVTQGSQKYSDTFESTLSDSRQSYFDSQSTVVESPRKTLTRYSYSTDSFELTSLSGSRYTSFESSSERPSYSDTFEVSKSDEETEASSTPTTSEDSEAAEEARLAEEGRYEHMVYGSVPQEKPAPLSLRKPKSRGEKQLNTYCRKKLEVIQNNERGDFKDTNQQKSAPSAHDKILVENYGISEGTVSRLKIHNLIDRMKQVASAEVHSPKKCRDCRHQIAQCKQDEYLKHKTAIARSKMVDERYETLCAKDSLAIFGEMIGSLPKLSDDPQDVWERLMKPLHEKDMNKQQNSPR